MDNFSLRLSRNPLVESSEHDGLATQAFLAAVHAGVENPATAIAQIADQATGSNSAAAVRSKFEAAGLEQRESAEVGTSPWMVQQVGGALGLMVPFLLLRSGVKHAAARAFGEESLLAASHVGAHSLKEAALREAALSGTTGFIYGLALTPGDEKNVGTPAFYADRLKTGLADGASFVALSFIHPYVSSGLTASSITLQNSTRFAAFNRPLISEALKSPLLSDLISAVPSGMIMAEAHALRNGHTLPSSTELKESVAAMTVVGGTLGTAARKIEEAGTTPNESVMFKVLKRSNEKDGQGTLAPAFEEAVSAQTENPIPKKEIEPFDAFGLDYELIARQLEHGRHHVPAKECKTEKDCPRPH